ncbi:proteinase inhibitor I4 serpin [Clostridium carboxidivorans P7]|uniref:Proteinase inhibitor I4 serpin n=1 Tax=Clostridium carboxidivorans P7 TaxID=536227 RepID=C6Q1X4_9CLOT|nr:serpin family protein [Clostridium carboxidivorans]AKN32255.1 proteinase inhibitor I4 serpin [Clostridium carboxidivorans P7]EET84512.1 proteinase inhibitor I4 serpin [Clostridium carboxidivorans P7]
MKNKLLIAIIFSAFLLIAPSVKAANYTDYQTVDKNKTWTIVFNGNVGFDDVTKQAITVTDSNGNPVNVSIQSGTDSKTVIVTAPQEGYTSGESYILNIGTKVHSNKGKALKKEYKLHFNIENDTDTMPIKTIDINEDSSVIQGNNNFAFNLMKQLTNKDKDKNIIISPLSISTILAETQNGANGQTKDEILNAIGLKNIDDKSINEQYYNTLNYYNSLNYMSSNSARLRVADSIWVNKNLSLTKSFVDTSKKYYNSEVNSVDFGAPDTVGTINQWVDKNTDGQIKKAINNIDESEKAILVNAISFKGAWENEFYPNNTKQEDFTLSSGEKVKIDTMQSTITNSYLKEDNFQAVRLPYYGGLEMDLFLPDRAVSVNDFMKEATKENFDKWLKEFSVADVNMKIPKFKLEYEEDNMKDVLKNLGMQQAFDPEKSSLDGISKSTFISDIIHKTCISVDEKGTEAAAITVEIACGSPAPVEHEKVDFVVDRPFVFAIRDCKTGAVIFIGKVENPRG